MELELAVLDLLHLHCENCFQAWKCNVHPKPGESCEIIICDLDCGARFHACKLAEHKLLCYKEKAPCINAAYGCPMLLPRKFLGRHLEVCPASVVHCTMEWNRWPVCSRERQMHIPFQQPNPHAKPGQLDVALALRDQRMLNESLKAPRRTRRALRNHLTRRFPAVPLQQFRGQSFESETQDSNQTSRTVSDDEADTPWEMKKTPPGLTRSMCSELYRASKHISQSLSAALNMITNYSVLIESKEESESNVNGYTETSMKDCGEAAGNTSVNGWPAKEPSPTKGSGENACEAGTSIEKTVVNGFTCDSDSECSADISSSDAAICMDSASDSSGKTGTFHSRFDVLFVDNTVVSEISSASMTDHARPQPPPPPPPPPPPISMNVSLGLGLDLTLESITRYQAKPKSMYTFLCAQDFRRDEFAWHYKNVHSDIHGSLNGWLEQRCPLAHYGCMFSLRRFYPTAKGYSVVHNEILESFGIKPVEEKHKKWIGKLKHFICHRNGISNKIDGYESDEDTSYETDRSSRESSPLPDTLSKLPFEVLQHIARFLDGFSLCNLSLTSRLLRDVCCSLLEEKGVVVQQWERKKIGNVLKWKITYKRWFFSTAFAPVINWGFEEEANMACHLQKCRFFERLQKTEPFFYPMGIDINPYTLAMLKQGIQNSLKNETSGETTKL